MITTVECPLFRRFPALEETLPKIDLCGGPSPVRRLDSLSRHLGVSDLWIKNDGLLGTVYGGNKVRKLEFVLADAVRRGSSHVVTFGATGSHHCLATAIYAPRLGMHVSMSLLEQPMTDEVERNLEALSLYGARVVRASSLPMTVLKSVLTAASAVRPGLPPSLPYVILVGASTPRGCVGYVNAAFELQNQIENGELPKPESIIVPLGSNGTAAGLLLGLRLAGLDTRLVAVQVSHLPGVGRRGVARLAHRTADFLRKHGASIEPGRFGPLALNTITDSETEQYGHPTQSGREAKRLMSEIEGVELDLTYTAKTVAQLIANDDLPRPVLYWHTLNAHPLPKAV
ncbi:MAG: 1-aminocyclopropane-1-carboxylate deaminase/D-cysteine desulfhydrase [Dehalococcoidia bacterium]